MVLRELAQRLATVEKVCLGIFLRVRKTGEKALLKYVSVSIKLKTLATGQELIGRGKVSTLSGGDAISPIPI